MIPPPSPFLEPLKTQDRFTMHRIESLLEINTVCKHSLLKLTVALGETAKGPLSVLRGDMRATAQFSATLANGQERGPIGNSVTPWILMQLHHFSFPFYRRTGRTCRWPWGVAPGSLSCNKPQWTLWIMRRCLILPRTLWDLVNQKLLSLDFTFILTPPLQRMAIIPFTERWTSFSREFTTGKLSTETETM